MRILLAEDEKDLASIIKRRLEDEGYAVDAVNNGNHRFYFLQQGIRLMIVLLGLIPVLMIILLSHSLLRSLLRGSVR